MYGGKTTFSTAAISFTVYKLRATRKPNEMFIIAETHMEQHLVDGNVNRRMSSTRPCCFISSPEEDDTQQQKKKHTHITQF